VPRQPGFSDETEFYREARYLVGLASVRELERDGVPGMRELAELVCAAYKEGKQ
jgi:hypothetical protein